MLYKHFGAGISLNFPDVQIVLWMLISRKRFKWTKKYEDIVLREVQASEMWTARSGNVKRRDGWKSVTDCLSRVQRPIFEVTARSVREIFWHLFQTRKAKNREEEKTSGIAPELSEVNMKMD